MSDTVIKVDGVGKKFCKTVKHTMSYGTADLLRNFFGLSHKTDQLRDGEFWALEDVSFELKRGECLGLIGPNGAGKSTLLKILNGIMSPDKGQVTISGRVGALIEVGAGFHPMLTGRENIYVNGSILGFSKREIDEKFDDIVTFSGLDEFIDSPVKFYSSGMYVRLGFAIAAQMEPDVLLIDEVLAVGDAEFSAKCFQYIGNCLRDSAVILVSHSMLHIRRNSTVCLNLKKGTVDMIGEPDRVIHGYLAGMKNIFNGFIHESNDVRYKNINIISQSDAPISFGGGLMVALELELSKKISCEGFEIVVSFLSINQSVVAYVSKKYCKFYKEDLNHSFWKLAFEVNSLPLPAGKYGICIEIFHPKDKSQLLWAHNVYVLEVVGGDHIYRYSAEIPSEWSVLPLSS